MVQFFRDFHSLSSEACLLKIYLSAALFARVIFPNVERKTLLKISLFRMYDTSMSRGRNAIFLVTFCICAWPAFGADAPAPPRLLRIDPSDVVLPAPDVPHSIRAVERFFKEPLTVPAVSNEWLSSVNESGHSAQLLQTAYIILVDTSPAVSHATLWPQPTLEALVKNLDAALSRAQPLLNKAVDSISAQDRRGLLELMDWPDEKTGVIQQDISARRIKKRYDGLKSYRQTDMLEAALIVAAAADAAIKASKNVIPPANSPPVRRIKMRSGLCLIGGPGDTTYSTDDVKRAALIIDLGGNNTYAEGAAAAREKQIRVIIDLGTGVTVNHRTSAPATLAAGIFGIGLFYAPRGGRHTVTSGSFSQGCGIGGVGGLFLTGESHLNGDRYVQGAAAFGAGLLRGDGGGSTYAATRSGQGAGFVRGVGIFRHTGDRAELRGGLVQPDPREPQGAVSMCQGVGFGRRAYAGGGVGIASVSGDDVRVTGSYFAQGCGYWHAHGLFQLTGNRSTLQARRYSLGSGVHYAFGHLRVDGNDNRVLNWGVGPGYGWDRAAGSFEIRGDRNEVQAEWGAGAAAVGGLSFGRISGNENRLKLPDLGSGGFMNEEFAYSFHVIEGSGTLLDAPVEWNERASVTRLRNPWGTGRVSGARWTKLNLEKPVWPELPQETARARESVNLQAILSGAEKKPPMEKAADLLDVTAAFSLDYDTPRQALDALLRQPDENAAALIEALEPSAVEQMIRLRIVISAYGEAAMRAIRSAYAAAPPQKKSVLLSLAGRLPPAEALSFLVDESFNGASTRLRLSAVRALGAALSRDTGQEPGARAVLASAQKFLAAEDAERKQLESLLSRMRVADAFALLAACVPLNAEARSAFLKAAPKDITESIGANGAREFTRQLALGGAVAQKRVHGALSATGLYETRVRDGLFSLLPSTASAETALAILVLGQLGVADDAPRLVPYLFHDKGAVREAAAVALGRMGETGLRLLNDVFTSTPTARGRVMAALPHAVSDKSEDLLLKGLRDGNPDVRLQALAVFGSLPPVLEDKRPQLVKRVKNILRHETDPSVRLAALLLN